MENFERFLSQSPLAVRVAVPTQIVVRRGALSPQDLGALRQDGALVPPGDAVCELEVGGQVVARGRLVTKRGRKYFQVLETGERGEA